MADQATAVAPVSMQPRAATIQSMQVAIKGRIELSRVHEGTRYTQIMTPAADQYSRPQIVEVRSKSKLGERGEEISIVAKLGGFTRRAYESKNKSTGEITMIVPVDHVLDAVEA